MQKCENFTSDTVFILVSHRPSQMTAGQLKYCTLMGSLYTTRIPALEVLVSHNRVRYCHMHLQGGIKHSQSMSGLYGSGTRGNTLCEGPGFQER